MKTIKTAKEWYEAALKRMDTFEVAGLMPALRHANDGAIEDVLNTNGCANYQWGACLVDIMKPRQVVELGGAMGVWSICALHYLPQDSRLYSITLAESGLEFSYIRDVYKNFVPVIGDDLDLSNWPKDLDLKKTDLWYFDTGIADDHFATLLQKEMELYCPFIKQGALILFDDIHKNEGMSNVWKDIKNGKWGEMDCYDATNPLHYTGYGLAVKL